jgi:hypothetical protein
MPNTVCRTKYPAYERADGESSGFGSLEVAAPITPSTILLKEYSLFQNMANLPQKASSIRKIYPQYRTASR